MRTGNRTVAIALGLFALIVPAGARAEPPTLVPAEPLTVPTPAAPKLRLPEMAPPPASMMLEQIHPLQVPSRSAERPTLNQFPSAEVGSEDEEDEGGDERGQAPRLRLQH